MNIASNATMIAAKAAMLGIKRSFDFVFLNTDRSVSFEHWSVWITQWLLLGPQFYT